MREWLAATIADLPVIVARRNARVVGRASVAFSRRYNQASLRAHEEMGMREVAGFDHDGASRRPRRGIDLIRARRR